jgi:hypothetical protein
MWRIVAELLAVLIGAGVGYWYAKKRMRDRMPPMN